MHSGSVSLADAVARARGIAAEKGVSYDAGRRNGSMFFLVEPDTGFAFLAYDTDSSPAPNRDNDPRLAGRNYRPRSRSRSRSPPRMGRDGFRDSYNPYRDERRDDSRRSGFRDRSYSPQRVGNFSPRGYGGPVERSPPGRRDDDNSETIAIQSSLVGLIIGRQGENLRRVEADTSSRVQFMTGPDANSPSRQCKISGTRKAREDAKAEIFRIIEENGNSRGGNPINNQPVVVNKGVGTHQPALRAGEDATQIMVPNRTVGLIIGRGGETIRDLQERSQCHVNIVGEEKSINGLRPVNLIGTPQAASLAKNLIMEIVESDTKNMSNQGGPSRDQGRGGGYSGGDGDKINDEIVVPSDAVGMIIGKGPSCFSEGSTLVMC